MENVEAVDQSSISDEQQSPSLHEGVLSADILARCDSDIQTMVALGELAAKHGAVSVISGGYAVEAHCGGRITRAHRDMDVHWQGQDSFSQQAIDEIQAVLQQNNSRWQTIEKKPGESYQFDEMSESGKKGRRLEWSNDHFSRKGNHTKYLIDSQNNKHEVTVPPLEEVISTKAIIFELKNAMTPEEKSVDKRYMTGMPQDIREFRRLLALPSFNQEACINYLEGYFKHEKGKEGEEITSEQAQILAQEKWSKTMEFINEFESPK